MICHGICVVITFATTTVLTTCDYDTVCVIHIFVEDYDKIYADVYGDRYSDIYYLYPPVRLLMAYLS